MIIIVKKIKHINKENKCLVPEKTDFLENTYWQR